VKTSEDEEINSDGRQPKKMFNIIKKEKNEGEESDDENLQIRMDLGPEENGDSEQIHD